MSVSFLEGENVQYIVYLLTSNEAQGKVCPDVLKNVFATYYQSFYVWAPARGVRADDFLCVCVTLTESRQKTDSEREGWDPLGHRLVGHGKFCILYQ